MVMQRPPIPPPILLLACFGRNAERITNDSDVVGFFGRICGSHDDEMIRAGATKRKAEKERRKKSPSRKQFRKVESSGAISRVAVKLGFIRVFDVTIQGTFRVHYPIGIKGRQACIPRTDLNTLKTLKNGVYCG
jgi:hypothetical protein